jgi:cellulose synthase/poly-beta-1,6-N-acetylglucosamine synthase-like glycosyltransferase
LGPVEIIYVDSESHDGSPERARALGAQVISVRPVRPSAAIGRNAGWRSANSDYVLFLDGDTVLEPGFVERALREMQDPDVAVVWGHRRESCPEASVYNRVMDLDWIYPAGPSDFCGGDALMRREVLDAVGGFSAELIAGEEPELCQRIRARGLTILHVDQPMTRHDLAIGRWSAYWKRAVRAGYAYAEISQRLKATAFPLWTRDARRNAIHATLLLGTVVMAPMLALAVGGWWPLFLGLALLLALVLRSAYKARWKCSDRWTLICYGVHSHLQQIPIAVGQLSYWWDRLRGRHRFLIEYK